MTLEDVLAEIPEGWYFDLAQPPRALRASIRKGKKWVPVRYTVYVSNGETFRTPFHASALVDGDDLIQTVIGAVQQVKKQEQEKQEEAKRLRK